MTNLSRTLAALAVASVICPTVARGETTLPPGFADVLVTDAVAVPTAMAFTPDGRLLITEQTGALRIVEGGVLLPTPAIRLGSRICTNIERGLLGVAVHPAFAQNGFIYLYYTFNKFGTCATQLPTYPVNRVSRFVLADNLINPATELILVDNIPSVGGMHNAGDLHFGADGHLYIAVGNGGCDYAGDSGCGGDNDASRDPNVLLGKILRVTANGDIPPTNPFQGAGTARCNDEGRTQPGLKCRETFASGLRNPFKMAFDPNSQQTRFLINDVGQNVWEEIDLGIPGADYGWNVREGPCANGSYTDCGPPPAGMINPIFSYLHASGCGAITGGAFVPKGEWPAEFDGSYLFADFNCGKIFRLSPELERSTFADGLGDFSAVALTFGPYGDGQQALYYTTFPGGGALSGLRAIILVSGNRPPNATATATPQFGPTPLTVTFDASASNDPDGDLLTFEWNFGDGSPTSSLAIASHTYSVAGTYLATVTVRDASDENTVTLRVDPGNTPPIPVILTPTPAFRFSVGEIIVLRGFAYDLEDGAFVTNLSWRVTQHHGNHVHPFLAPTPGSPVAIVAPQPEDLLAASNSYLEIDLTAVDSRGLARTIRQVLRPRLVTVTLTSVPSSISLRINELTVATARTFFSWAAWPLHLVASSQLDPGGSGKWLIFDRWFDGGPAERDYVTPPAPSVVTALYRLAPNAALNRPVLASSMADGMSSGRLAVDGNPATAWRTAPGSPQWLAVDLGTQMIVERVLLRWGPSDASSYSLWTSPDGVNWTSVHDTIGGNGGNDDVLGLAAGAQFVGIYATAPTEGAYSLAEIEVYGRGHEQ